MWRVSSLAKMIGQSTVEILMHGLLNLYRFFGVAPEATILSYKVFSAQGGVGIWFPATPLPPQLTLNKGLYGRGHANRGFSTRIY